MSLSILYRFFLCHTAHVAGNLMTSDLARWKKRADLKFARADMRLLLIDPARALSSILAHDLAQAFRCFHLSISPSAVLCDEFALALWPRCLEGNAVFAGHSRQDGFPRLLRMRENSRQCLDPIAWAALDWFATLVVAHALDTERTKTGNADLTWVWSTYGKA